MNLTQISTKKNTPSNSDRMRTSREVMSSYIDMLDKRSGGEKHYIKSGLTGLDNNLGGWLHEGHLIVIAARPAMGKSAIAQQIAENVAVNSTVIFYTLEMQAEELAERSIARETGISVQKLKIGENFSDEDWSAMTQAASKFIGLKLRIDDFPVYVENIANKSRKIAEELNANGEKLGLIVVDYAQIVNTMKKSGNRTLEVGEITMALKSLAKELLVPVIALAQLNRNLESRTDKRPNLSDLRESGQIEQDADLVLFLYRDEIYNENSADKGIVEIITGKNRHGELGTTRMAFVGNRMLFGDLAHSIGAAEYVY